MFGLFKSTPFSDPSLGKLERSRGLWRGSIDIAGSTRVPLAIAGRREQPDQEALQLAREAASQWPSWHPAIEAALFDHYLPHAEAAADGNETSSDEAVSHIENAGEIWPHVALVFVAVVPLDGVLAIELGYQTAWDEEHTLGARIQRGRLVELCGSVLRP